MSANLMIALGTRLQGGTCTPLGSDQRIHIELTGLFTYADLVVVCGEPQFLDDHFDTLLNPKVIIEVLSPSTELYDRVAKFEQYRSIRTLTEYVLVNQERVSVERYQRQADGQWLLRAGTEITDVLSLPSIRCEIPLTEIYNQIHFELAVTDESE